MNTPATNSGYPDAFSMREARDRFLASNGFRVDDYSAPTYTIKFWRFAVRFPNTKGHRWATPLHDLHHILTGYRTDWIGEAEIGAWELRAGCKSFITYFLNGSGVIIGLFISPRRVCRAFRTAKGQRTLYYDSIPYDHLLKMSVGELRKRLGIYRQI